jgi:hypothetical protein
VGGYLDVVVAVVDVVVVLFDVVAVVDVVVEGDVEVLLLCCKSSLSLSLSLLFSSFLVEEE